MTLLARQIEQAQLMEARDLPVVQVLDRAVPAERPARPDLVLNVGVAGLGGLFLGILLAFSFDSMRRLALRRV